MSIREAAKTSSFLRRKCRSVYRGSCKTSYLFCVDVAVSIGEAAKHRAFCYVDVAMSIGEAAKRRVFCYVDVAVSIGEAATPPFFCYVDVAVSIGEAATPRVFCYVDVAVSIGEVVCLSFVVHSSTGTCLCICSTQ